MNDESTPPDAPGWEAIDRAVGMRYPAQVPHQFASSRPYELDGRAPLPAVTVWSSGAPSSWHYVSYGLSELFEKTSPDPSLSGFGIELTLRVPRTDDEAQPPTWGVTLMQTLGHYVLSRRRGFDSGHTIDLQGPITGTSQADCPITGVVLLPDPILRPIQTPHGDLLFLQLVGLHARELEVFEHLELEAQVGAMADLDAAMLTDPSRGCWLDDAERAKVIRRYKLGIGID